MTHAPIPSRRTLLALAPAALVAAPLPAVAADPDAELIGLGETWAALGSEMETMADALSAIEDAADASLSWPDALCVKPRDWFGGMREVGKALTPDAVQRWRNALASGLYRSCMTAGTQAAFEARGREVIAAWEAHMAARSAFLAATPYADLQARSEVIGRAHYATERQIIDTPAAGLGGLRVKARAAMAAIGQPDGTYEDHAARAVLADLIGAHA